MNQTYFKICFLFNILGLSHPYSKLNLSIFNKKNNNISKK